MKRPDWVEEIVALWGIPVVEVNSPERARVPATDGTRGTEIRYVRMWMWSGPRDEPWGVRLWNTDPHLRHVRIVVEASGPVGAANYSRPGVEMPLAAIVSVLELAGIPPYNRESGEDLTSRQPVNYARDSTANPNEGEHVNRENSEQAENVTGDNRDAVAYPGESIDPNVAGQHTAAPADGPEGLDTEGAEIDAAQSLTNADAQQDADDAAGFAASNADAE